MRSLSAERSTSLPHGLGRGGNSCAHDMASTGAPTDLYSTHVFGQLSAQGRYFVFRRKQKQQQLRRLLGHFGECDGMVGRLPEQRRGQQRPGGHKQRRDLRVHRPVGGDRSSDPADPLDLSSSNEQRERPLQLGRRRRKRLLHCSQHPLWRQFGLGKGWQWSGTSALSDPAVYNGVVFVETRRES